MRGYFGIGVEGISKPMNLGAILRTAHAFRASFAFAIQPALDVNELLQSDTSIAIENMPVHVHPSLERFALRRSERVRVTATDLDGNAVEIAVDGWRARIMQHEFDHLDGILYVDRLDDGDWKTVQKIARKRGWGRPGSSWTPSIDDLDA